MEAERLNQARNSPPSPILKKYARAAGEIPGVYEERAHRSNAGQRLAAIYDGLPRMLRPHVLAGSRVSCTPGCTGLEETVIAVWPVTPEKAGVWR